MWSTAPDYCGTQILSGDRGGDTKILSFLREVQLGNYSRIYVQLGT